LPFCKLQEIDEQDLLDDQRAKPTKSESIKSQSRDRAKMSSDQGNTTAEESEATAGEYNDDFEGEDATGDAAPQSQSPISDAKPGDHDISPFVQVDISPFVQVSYSNEMELFDGYSLTICTRYFNTMPLKRMLLILFR